MKKTLSTLTLVVLFISSLFAQHRPLEELVNDSEFQKDLVSFYTTLAEMSDPEIFKFYNNLPAYNYRNVFVAPFLSNMRKTFANLTKHTESHPKCLHVLYAAQGTNPIFDLLSAESLTKDNLPTECECSPLAADTRSINYLMSLVYGESVEKVPAPGADIAKEATLLLPKFKKIEEFWSKYPVLTQE